MTLELDELNVCCDSRYDFDVLFAVEDVVDQFVEDNFLLKTDSQTRYSECHSAEKKPSKLLTATKMHKLFSSVLCLYKSCRHI